MRAYIHIIQVSNPTDPTITNDFICHREDILSKYIIDFCNDNDIKCQMNPQLLKNLRRYDKKRKVAPYKKPPYITSYQRIKSIDYLRPAYKDMYGLDINNTPKSKVLQNALYDTMTDGNMVIKT